MKDNKIKWFSTLFYCVLLYFLFFNAVFFTHELEKVTKISPVDKSMCFRELEKDFLDNNPNLLFCTKTALRQVLSHEIYNRSSYSQKFSKIFTTAFTFSLLVLSAKFLSDNWSRVDVRLKSKPGIRYTLNKFFWLIFFQNENSSISRTYRIKKQSIIMSLIFLSIVYHVFQLTIFWVSEIFTIQKTSEHDFLGYLYGPSGNVALCSTLEEYNLGSERNSLPTRCLKRLVVMCDMPSSIRNLSQKKIYTILSNCTDYRKIKTVSFWNFDIFCFIKNYTIAHRSIRNFKILEDSLDAIKEKSYYEKNYLIIKSIFKNNGLTFYDLFFNENLINFLIGLVIIILFFSLKKEEQFPKNKKKIVKARIFCDILMWFSLVCILPLKFLVNKKLEENISFFLELNNVV